MALKRKKVISLVMKGKDAIIWAGPITKCKIWVVEHK